MVGLQGSTRPGWMIKLTFIIRLSGHTRQVISLISGIHEHGGLEEQELFTEEKSGLLKPV